MASDLTSSEQLIWSGQRLDPSSPLYNMALAIELPIAIDVAAFRRAFQRLVDGTDALRTSYVERDGAARRVVHEQCEGVVELLLRIEDEHDDRTLAAELEARTRRTFALDGPLYDCALIVRRPDRHIWYLNQHHLITDAWSVGVLHRRMARLYEQALTEQALTEQALTEQALTEQALTEPAPGEQERSRHEDADQRRTTSSPLDLPQFSSFVDFQESLRASPRLAGALAFWDAAAGGGTRRLALYGNASPGSGRTRRVRIRLDAARTSALRAMASRAPFRALTREQSHFQLFATLLLAWAHRVSDSSRVAIGTPFHNRSTAAFRDVAGLFVELVPLRVDVGDAESFASLGAQVAERTREVLRHVVPGACASPGARGFGLVLNYITAQLGEFSGAAVRADWIHSGFGDHEHRLRLQVHDFDMAGDPIVDFDLDEGTFGSDERAWAVRHFLALFDALAADPDAVIADVDLTDSDEEAAFAPRGTVARHADSVLALVRAAAERTPAAVAVTEGDRALTYAELTAASACLARSLAARGIGLDAVVGVALDRSIELVVAVLAILEAGAAFVPLDRAHPDQRLRFLVSDAGVRLVLTDAAYQSRVDGWGVASMLVDAAATDEVHDAPAAAAERSPGALAYVLYTSGSTGMPKGVEVTHGALADYVSWAAHRYGSEPGLAWPLFTSPAFDLTLTSLLVPLASGGTIVVYRGNDGDSAVLVRRVFEDNRVDVVKLTPSHLALVRDLDLSHSRIRRLIVGGEDLTRATALAVHEALGGRAELLNEYGPTEATVACMLHRFDPLADGGASVPIGRPTDNVRIRVADNRGRAVPRGATGEIRIAGTRVARGYRGRPDLTAAAFVTDADGERWYRTGDVGRWPPDGRLEYLGRRDGQVKVRGVRVELTEIEGTLARHPAIERCVVQLAAVTADGADARCVRCGLEGAHPEARLDEALICAVCRRFESERANVARYFGTMDDLRDILAQAKRESAGPHDCLMLLSGGKDSTYALSRIVELGARPLVFLFDNGFISGQAKANVRRVVEQLGLELVVGETPAMPAIFAESLARFSNVCNGCYKAIYTLAMQLAESRGIRHIVTGLSRGQIFETRLADLYRRGIYDPEEVDRTILEARKAYHRMDDAVAREMDVSLFESDAALERIRFVDFYRYCDASLDEILQHVAAHTPWIRPTDTGRSTNCLINQAGIFVHKAERGFHNYAMPYSWDVRLGHKERDAAVAELDDELDPVEIRDMLQQVGHEPRSALRDSVRLVAYFTARDEVTPSELRHFLEETLPREVIPSAFVQLEHIPLAASGKVDRSALPQLTAQRTQLASILVAPRNEVERVLAALWSEVLDTAPIGVRDDYFELGGDSMQCIQIVTAARARGLLFSPRDVFNHPTIAELAEVVTRIDDAQPATAASASAAELAELLEEFGDGAGAST